MVMFSYMWTDKLRKGWLLFFVFFIIELDKHYNNSSLTMYLIIWCIQ